MHAAFENGCTADTPVCYRAETSSSISKQTTRSITLSQTSILSEFLCEALNQKRLSFVIKYQIDKLFSSAVPSIKDRSMVERLDKL